MLMAHVQPLHYIASSALYCQSSSLVKAKDALVIDSNAFAAQQSMNAPITKAIRLDNGSELTSQHLARWCKDKGIELRFIQPGKPNQNAFIERFNRSCRTEVPDGWLLTSLDEVRESTHQWL